MKTAQAFLIATNLVVAASGLGGCASVDRVSPEGMRTRGVEGLLFKDLSTTFDADAARATVLSRGAAHPDERVRAKSQELACDQTGETASRLGQRSRWDRAAGKTPQIACQGQ